MVSTRLPAAVGAPGSLFDSVPGGRGARVGARRGYSSPPVSGGAHVRAPYIWPLDDREDEDDQGAAEHGVAPAGVEAAVDGLGRAIRASQRSFQADSNSNRGSSSTGKRSPRNASSQMGDQGAQRHALIQRLGVSVRHDWPLH